MDEGIQIPMEIICHDPQNRDAPCPICDGKGVIMWDVPLDDPRYGKLQRCPNHPVDTDTGLHERLRRLGNLEAYKDKTFENFKTDYFYRKNLFHGLSDKERQESESKESKEMGSLNTALQRAIDFVREPQGWIVYEGPYGCGKTHLAVAIANARLEQFGEQVLFITAPDLLDFLRMTFDPNAEFSYREAFEQICNVPLLALDDLGVENPSGWAKEKLFQLLNHRHAKALPTVITTNTELDELDPRISSRMREGGVVTHVQIKARDYRKQTPRDEDRYFSNLHLYYHMRFDTFKTDSILHEEIANLKKALEAAKQWAATPMRWLYIAGGFGTGKTHLAAAIANDLHDRGQEVLFITVPNFLDYLHRSFNPESRVRFDKRFDKIMIAPILILDDLRPASATDWAREKLFQIIDYRYVTRLPTVITSSEGIEKIDERFRTRLLDRRICYGLKIKVPSYAKRWIKKKR